jgi:hypothetical protein
MMVDLKKYKSHKVVEAAKIEMISLNTSPDTYWDGKSRLTFAGGVYVIVERHYMRKHEPQVGGYYVLYKDGYESFSPAEAFESGYELVVNSDGEV